MTSSLSSTVRLSNIAPLTEEFSAEICSGITPTCWVSTVLSQQRPLCDGELLVKKLGSAACSLDEHTLHVIWYVKLFQNSRTRIIY